MGRNYMVGDEKYREIITFARNFSRAGLRREKNHFIYRGQYNIGIVYMQP
jgi:hypothetical protein